MAVSSALAAAAAGASNPFGLPGIRRTGSMLPDGGPQGYQLFNPQQPAGQAPTTQNSTTTPVMPIPTVAATTPGAAAAPTPNAGQFSFDLQTDPALQQVNALTGLSDQQAHAQALKEQQQQLLQYGDPSLAASVLGSADPTVQATGQNQESDLAMLARQYGQNVHDFETQLDPSLTFSGYKINQEQRLGQAYQDAIAKAAAGVEGNLDSITGNLNSALQQNASSRANALEQAYANELALILAGLGGGATAGDNTTPPPTDQTIHGTPPPAPFAGPPAGSMTAPFAGPSTPSLSEYLKQHPLRLPK